MAQQHIRPQEDRNLPHVVEGSNNDSGGEDISSVVKFREDDEDNASETEDPDEGDYKSVADVTVVEVVRPDE